MVMSTGGTTELDGDSDIWVEIEDDVRAAFGEGVDFEIEDYGEYIEVRILPNGAVDDLAAEHSDLLFVPFNAGRMTIRRER